MADPVATYAVGFEGDYAELNKGFDAFVERAEARKVRVPFEFVPPEGGGANPNASKSTFGNPTDPFAVPSSAQGTASRVPTSGLDGASIAQAANISRSVSGGVPIENGSPGVRPGGVGSSRFGGEELSSIEAAAAIDTSQRISRLNIPTVSVGRTGSGITPLDRLINRVDDYQNAAMNARGQSDEGAYSRQYNEEYNRGVSAGVFEGPEPQPQQHSPRGAGGHGGGPLPFARYLGGNKGLLGQFARTHPTIGRFIGPAAGIYAAYTTVESVGSIIEGNASREAGQIRGQGTLEGDYQAEMDYYKLRESRGPLIDSLLGGPQDRARIQNTADQGTAGNNLAGLRQSESISRNSIGRQSNADITRNTLGAYAGAKEAIAGKIADLDDAQKSINEYSNSIIKNLTDQKRGVRTLYEFKGSQVYREGVRITNGDALSQGEADAVIDNRVQVEQSQIQSSINGERERAKQSMVQQQEALRSQSSLLSRERNIALSAQARDAGSGIYEVNRNAAGALYSQFSQEYYAATQGPEEDRTAAMSAAQLRLRNSTALIRRDNREATSDLNDSTLATQQQGNRQFFAAERTRNELGRTQALREIGGTGIGFVDAALGYSGRRDAVNREYDANNQANINNAKFASDQNLLAATSGAASTQLRTAGFSQAAANRSTWAASQASIAALDRTDGNYAQNYQSVQVQANAGYAQNAIAEQQARVGSSASYEAGILSANRQPLQASLRAARGQFDASTVGQSVFSPQYIRSAGAYFAQHAELTRQDNDNRRQIDIEQTYEGKSLDRSLARDPIGAQAFQIAGSTLGRVAQLQGQGPQYADEIARARQLGDKQLDLLNQNYAYSFRGEQVDLRSIAVNNPRDSQNPSEVFAQIAQAKNDALNGKGLDDTNGGGLDLSKVTGGATIQQVIDALKDLAGGE